MTATFFEFVDRKQRATIRHLKIIKRILDHTDIQTAAHVGTAKNDPFLYVYNPDGTTNFGLRVYGIGDQLAFRLQRKEDTHPYGKPEQVDIESMWDDLKADGKEDGAAASQLIKDIGRQFRDYFKESAKAEKRARRIAVMDPPLGAADLPGSIGQTPPPAPRP
jgi:hypothetical protein